MWFKTQKGVAMNVIKMQDLESELQVWGFQTRMEYDANGDGWVIVAGNPKIEEFLIHHGFEYDGSIYADVDRLVVEPIGGKPILGMQYILAKARTQRFVELSAFPFTKASFTSFD